MGQKKEIKRIDGFAIQFLPYHEIRDLNSDERIKKILSIVLGNSIIILQGRLKPLEETRLIGDTMAMIGHIPSFKGIELAVIEDNNEESVLDTFRKKIVNVLERGNSSAVTIIGPDSIVKEIKKNPKKIELLLNK